VTNWPSVKARIVFRTLLKKGWQTKSQRGSHVQLIHPLYGEYTWVFHDLEEIGPRMLARIAKKTGLARRDL
jgi:predicted RNA binding protein YcfA (HicA-like mRNA interferase family)